MSDVEQILAVVGFFYLIEGLYWARPSAIVFVAGCFDFAWPSTAAKSSWLANEHGGLLFGNLFPIGYSTAVQPWPFSVSPLGVVAFVRGGGTDEAHTHETGRVIRFADVKSIDHETTRIRINGKPFVTVGSPSLARYLAKMLKQIADTPEVERATCIETTLAETCSVPILRDHARTTFRETRMLRIAAMLVFLFAFVVIPIRIYGSTTIDWIQMAMVYATLLLFTLIECFFAHRRLRREHGADRAKQLATMLISPADTMHAPDHILREVFEEYHPITVAAVLCRRQAFADLSRGILLDLRHPREQARAAPGDAATIESWYVERLEPLLLAAIRDAGHDPAQLLTPPGPYDAASVAYCPRCWGQFVRVDAICTRCTIPLVAFDGQSPTPPNLPALPPPRELPSIIAPTEMAPPLPVTIVVAPSIPTATPAQTPAKSTIPSPKPNQSKRKKKRR